MGGLFQNSTSIKGFVELTQNVQHLVRSSYELCWCWS